MRIHLACAKYGIIDNELVIKLNIQRPPPVYYLVSDDALSAADILQFKYQCHHKFRRKGQTLSEAL